MSRRDVFLNGIADAIPLACGMLAVSCALPTAFSIGFSLIHIILFCVLSALLLAFWMDAPRFGFGFGAIFLSIVILICAFRMRRIVNGAVVFASDLYNEFPGELSDALRGFLQFDPEQLAAAAGKAENPDGAVTVVMILIAAANGLLMTGAMTRSKTVLLSLMVPLPALLIGLIHVQKQPKVWVIVLLTFYFGYALLGNGLRKGEAREKNVFSLLLAPALLTLALLILIIVPPSRYRPIPEDERREFFNDLFANIADPFMAMIGTKNPRTVDLDKEEERVEDDRRLFDLESSQSGVYHLRTHSYGVYRDNSWQNADPYTGEWSSMEALGKRTGQKPRAWIEIAESFSDERAVPYGWVKSDERTAVGEFGIRSGGMKQYGWYFAQDYLSVVPETPGEAEIGYYTDYAVRQYLMPDGAEKDALLKIAADAGIVPSQDAYGTAREIASFVCHSGTYTKKPEKAPRGEDFILYFLTEGHEGYCVHFASATTALLQALGYPARYTVGYYVRVEADEIGTIKPVTKNDEHAWAEVYVLGLGWIPIESTPQFEDDGVGTSPQSSPQTVQSTPTPRPTAMPQTPTPIPVESQPTVVPETAQPLPVPVQAEDPEGSGTGEAHPEEKKRGSLWWIVIPLIPLLWVGTGLSVRRIRDARFRNADIKRSIPEMAHYLARLERFGVPKDPDAEAWALEAVFSNHTMHTEHKELLRRVRTAQHSVYANAPVRRFLLRWVLYFI